MEESVCREAELLRLAEHENVVALLGCLTEGPNVILVLEWCDTDLEQVRRAWRKLPSPAHDINAGATSSYQAAARGCRKGPLRGPAARSGRLPRARHSAPGASPWTLPEVPFPSLCQAQDVKPANLLIGQDGRLKLADFGNACARPEAPLTPGPTTRCVSREGPTHLFAECFAAGIVPQSCSTAPGTTTAPWICGQLAACSRSCLAASQCSRARATLTSWRRCVARGCVRAHISPGQWLTFHVRPDLLAAGRAE